MKQGVRNVNELGFEGKAIGRVVLRLFVAAVKCVLVRNRIVVQISSVTIYELRMGVC